MATTEKLWPMDGHTEGKHLVLRAYLDRWLGILSNRFNKLLFIDGFSGPGEYSTGEDGSPLIALKSVIEHTHKALKNTQITYIFIEHDPIRAEHLRNKIDATLTPLPKNIIIQYLNCSFKDAVEDHVLPKLQKHGGNPCFVMADPFGIGHIPMDSFQKLMKFSRVELYISFMYEFINRFRNQKAFEEPLITLFGSDSWKAVSELENSEERKRETYKLYKTCLKKCCQAQVVHFDLYNGNRLKYGIFFATQSIKGSHKIKEAIWKVVPNGSFAFRSEQHNSMKINIEEPDFIPLQEAIINEFSGKGLVPITRIAEYVASDQTDYHPGQLKTHCLKVIERNNVRKITIKRTVDKPRRKLTYPDDCLIQID